MISTIEVVKFLKEGLPDLNIYPLEIPLTAPDNTCVIELQSNKQATAGVFSVNLQIKVRDTHPSLSEATSYRFKEFLDNKSNFTLGTTQVLLVKASNPIPLNVGKDLNGRYLFSNNFKLLINEGD